MGTLTFGLNVTLDGCTDHRAGLIDEYRFLVQPILAGAGPTLYAGALADPLRLQLVRARALRCGAIDAHYRRGR
ncbi:dihydrofolate reductase family protein [Microbacterium sp. ZXX196]|uniref:dihydrofolate reductase family protein n=1 Tax=Microbacterium sp. ZXX196 TaxID=2609291 RepID=UPI0012B73375|nr:dihydrofolate reductase family protein [Microbacterium sp. ZXX196]MTE24747.1 hypothetical protein [Microbacterium sp. ZXX196]